MFPQTNVGKATAVGVGAGGFAAYAMNYAAQYALTKYGVPVEVSLPAMGALAGLFMRWAAKLHPAQ